MSPADRGRTGAADAVFATFGVAYLIAYVLYNITEGGFKALNFLFVIFLVTAIEYPKVPGDIVQAPSASFLSWRRVASHQR